MKDMAYFWISKNNLMKPMMNLTLLFLFWCTACSKSEFIMEARNQEKTWNEKNISNYSYTLWVNCYCPTERVGPHLIKVINNKIVTVNGQPYNPQVTGPLPTITELFEIIRLKLSQKPYQQKIAYHPELGYPNNVYVDMDQRIADEEIGYIIENLVKE
jgi:hypothetical protein